MTRRAGAKRVLSGWVGGTHNAAESWGQQPRREAAGAGLHGSVLQNNHIKDYRVG